MDLTSEEGKAIEQNPLCPKRLPTKCKPLWRMTKLKVLRLPHPSPEPETLTDLAPGIAKGRDDRRWEPRFDTGSQRGLGTLLSLETCMLPGNGPQESPPSFLGRFAVGITLRALTA